MNTVELLGTYGGDKTHAGSAWASTQTDVEANWERGPGLLKRLAKDGHETPFEKSALHFLVRTDIATHIHLLKHRIGVSINAESARYKELKSPTFHIPEDWPEKAQRITEMHYQQLSSLYHELVESLSQHGLSRKRAKESARFVLPYANQITSDVMFNFRSFVNFQRLRNKPDAQVEVRQVAQDMLDLVRDVPDFHHSLLAFGLR